MKKYDDYIADTFGKWTVTGIKRVQYGKGPSRRIFTLRCECGSEGQATASDLNHARTTMCRDCSYKENYRLSPSTAAINKEYGNYQRNADKKGLTLSISREEFENLILSKCFYCDREPFRKLISSWDSVLANGIDRIDSSVGYIEGNIRTCCWDCNRMKGDLAEEDFLSHLALIHKVLTDRQQKDTIDR